MGKEARLWAKEHREGNKWNVWQAILVMGAISGAASYVGILIGGFISFVNEDLAQSITSLLSSIIEFALLPMTIGIIVYVVNIVKGKKFELGQLFCKYNQFFRIFITNLLVCIFVFLYTLLLIVPGIIRAISYFLVNYILADSDFDNLSSGEILDLSRKIMDGHKAEYFKMNLYYFFMAIVGMFTLGILWIWTIPEMNLANAKFATNLIDEYKKNNKEK
jgi:uncharacterized membrane protein